MTDDPFGLGSALAFAVHSPVAAPTPPWQPLTTRIDGTALRARVEHVARALGSTGDVPVDDRTAASTEHFGLVARFVAAHICARSLGFSIDLSEAEIWWSQPEGAMLTLSAARRDTARDPLHDSVIESYTLRVQQTYDVSPQVLWGNVGSAANSTLNLLRTARPELLPTAQQAADDLLTDARIAGGTLRTGPDFRRRSCCLIYRAGIGLCGDCVLSR
ncbi:(2Fe-2S)-binding protein [Flexivirga sp. B27]